MKYTKRSPRQQPIPSFKGSRIINLDKLQEYTSELIAHSQKCNSTITLTGEKRQGLASIFCARCSLCDINIDLQTSSKVKGPRGYPQWECNLAAVWAEMLTVGGHSRLEETLGVLISTERAVGEQWRKALENSMVNAGQEEKKLAIARGEFHEGVPAITVIVDGGWSKRSHKHSYNAKSRVAIIIGKETKKTAVPRCPKQILCCLCTRVTKRITRLL